MFNNSSGVSVRSAAPKFGASKSSVHKTLQEKTCIVYRKKMSIPDRSDTQATLAKTKCGRLLRKFRDEEFILDDESYLTFSHSDMAGNDGFYSKKPGKAPADVRFKKRKKFEQKVLVWVAISPQGLSHAMIKKSGYAINAERYLNECIRRRLIPYIRTHYPNGGYVFWPDQASSHYAKIVIEYLRQENIKFVEKNDNPANVPEIRPIEDFWSILKRHVYAKGWKAKTHDQLIRRIKFCLKKIDKSVVQKLARSTKTRIDRVRRYGVIENRDK